MSRPTLHLDTPLARALVRLLARLESALAPTRAVRMYLAGGMAVHLYTGARVTTDVDAELDARVFLPPDLSETVETDEGPAVLFLDTTYSPGFALLHEAYQEDALPVPGLPLERLALRVLSPTDLAVSKIARLAPVDREDIAALAALGLTTPGRIERRAREAEAAYVGGRQLLAHNIRDAVAIARGAQGPGARKGPAPD